MAAHGARRNRQRGFSLIVVFLLIVVMVGVASAVMMTAQGDLQVSGHDREAAAALYAAEAGVAWAQWFLARQVLPGKTSVWNGLLQSADGNINVAFCPVAVAPALRPGTLLPAPGAAVVQNPGQLVGPTPLGVPVTYDQKRGVTYQWCIHNNAQDPNYGSNGNAAADPVSLGGAGSDGDNIITVESYGWYGTGAMSAALASAHVTVDVSYYNASLGGAIDYVSSGGGSSSKGGSFEGLPPSALVSGVGKGKSLGN